MAVDIIARAMAANASGGSKDVDYGSVTNKPQINGITLEGNKTTSDLGIGEIIELKGTEENPIELANIGEPGIYKISGYFKPLLTSSASISNGIILEVAKTYDSISQHYWEGNSAFRMMVRVAASGIPFTENFHELSQNGDIENYSSINAFSLISSLNLSRYLGRGYMGKVLLTDLKTTDKKSLVNAINELVDIKQDKLTAGSGITIENNVISASGGGSAGITVLEGTEEAPVNLQNLTEAGLYFVKNCYIPSSLYAKVREDRFIINALSRTTNTMTQIAIATDVAGRFYWYSRSYNTATKEWNTGDFFSRYNDIGHLNNDRNYYSGQAIISYYGDTTKLETTNKNNLVNAINEVNAKISSGTLATNLAEVQGYDATKTQVLKNINGQFTWIDES